MNKSVWRQKLGSEDDPYLIRWVLDFYWFSIRVHHWLASDDKRHYHDHPWWFLTYVIKGGYVDHSPVGPDFVNSFCFRFRKATHRHYVEVDPGGCWTIMLTGKVRRVWGFWVDGRFRKRNKYFYEHGHH